jgi:hypothetical protein
MSQLRSSCLLLLSASVLARKLLRRKGRGRSGQFRNSAQPVGGMRRWTRSDLTSGQWRRVVRRRDPKNIRRHSEYRDAGVPMRPRGRRTDRRVPAIARPAASRTPAVEGPTGDPAAGRTVFERQDAASAMSAGKAAMLGLWSAQAAAAGAAGGPECPAIHAEPRRNPVAVKRNF